jgi:hypothetical protein
LRPVNMTLKFPVPQEAEYPWLFGWQLLKMVLGPKVGQTSRLATLTYHLHNRFLTCTVVAVWLNYFCTDTFLTITIHFTNYVLFVRCAENECTQGRSSLSVRPQAKTREPLDGSGWNLVWTFYHHMICVVGN